MTKKPFESREFRNAMGSFLTGVTVITVEDEAGEIHGMTANSFTSVSLEPPIILVCIDHKSKTLQKINKANKFGVNILSEKQLDVSKLFANQKTEKNPAYEVEVDGYGVPIIKESISSLSCRVVKAQEVGDHTVLYGEVDNLMTGEGEPLGFLKGKYISIDSMSS